MTEFAYYDGEAELALELHEAERQLWAGEIRPGTEPGTIGWVSDDIVRRFGELHHVDGVHMTNNLRLGLEDLCGFLVDPEAPDIPEESRETLRQQYEAYPKRHAFMWLKNNEPELCERAKEIVQAQRLALKEAGKDEDVELRRDVLTLLMSVWMFKVYKALEPYGEATGQSVDDWCR